ncbi:MAG: ABC transporter ATP-binding protein, partial [Pedobacter sp.]
MKTYLRLLSFAKPIEKFAIPYIIATLLAIFFNTFNFSLLSPLLDTLFNQAKETPNVPAKVAGGWDLLGTFRAYITAFSTEHGPMRTLQIVCGVIFVSVVLSNFFRYLSQRYMEDLRVHTLLNLRKSVFNNVMDLQLGFFNNERKGDIISKVASDVQVVQFTVTNTLQVVFKEPVQLIFYIVLLLLISVKLTLFSLLVIPVSGYIISKIVKRLKQQATAAQESFAKMIGFLDESLGAIKIIKAFNATERIKQRFHKENVYYSNLNRKMVRRQQAASPVSQTLGVLVVVSIVLYGGSLIILNKEDALQPSDFIAYIIAFSQVMQPVKALTDSFSGIHSGISAGERVLELIDTKAEVTDKPDAVTINEFNESITFENVG